jgi:hypothetical protein
MIDASTKGELPMSKNDSVVAVYKTHAEADAAVKELQRDGVDINLLSIIGKGNHTEEHAVGYYNTDGRMQYWGEVGASWAGSGHSSSVRLFS